MKIHVTDYQAYLQSPHWLKIKGIIYKKYHACQSCGSSKRLQVHHKTYKRIGKEKLSDLRLLCQQCHYRTHRLKAIGTIRPSDLFAIVGNWFTKTYGIT